MPVAQFPPHTGLCAEQKTFTYFLVSLTKGGVVILKREDCQTLAVVSCAHVGLHPCALKGFAHFLSFKLLFSVKLCDNVVQVHSCFFVMQVIFVSFKQFLLERK